MQMIDGEVWMITNVRHIPDIRKNILVVGVFEPQGCRFTDGDRTIKETKGSMMILKRERTTSLYHMMGNIFVVMLRRQRRRNKRQGFGMCFLNT